MSSALFFIIQNVCTIIFKIVIKKQMKTIKKCFLKILYFFLKNKKQKIIFFIMEIFYIDSQINYYKIQ